MEHLQTLLGSLSRYHQPDNTNSRVWAAAVVFILHLIMELIGHSFHMETEDPLLERRYQYHPPDNIKPQLLVVIIYISHQTMVVLGFKN